MVAGATLEVVSVTVAVCLRCGAFKRGAFTPCPGCRFAPDDDESLTKHLLVTDHYLTQEELQRIAQRIKAGEVVEFEPELLQQARVRKEQLETSVRRLKRGCSIVCLIILAVAAYALASWLGRP